MHRRIVIGLLIIVDALLAIMDLYALDSIYGVEWTFVFAVSIGMIWYWIKEE